MQGEGVDVGAGCGEGLGAVVGDPDYLSHMLDYAGFAGEGRGRTYGDHREQDKASGSCFLCAA